MTAHQVNSYLDALIGTRTPGLQYLVLNSAGPLFQYSAGWADIRHHRPMHSATTMMAYSMSKTITAVAVLLLIEG
jgi:CubicO group peptidase (beta-lactamase class C family)